MLQSDQKNPQNPETLLQVNPHSANFDFDVWAREVRLQMVTALQKNLDSQKTKAVIQ